jgi:cyclophilin family peptidyl-prolyl cis-trans isomerase
VRVAATAIPTTKTCTPLLNALRDPIRHIVILAVDLLDPACVERDDVVERLRSWMHELSSPTSAARWQISTHALLTLVKFEPDEARQFAAETAASHELWQVRAAAARIAGAVKDEALALRLLKDDEANVRTDALRSLAEMRSPTLVEAALASLESDDYQLVLTAAIVLKRVALGEALAAQLGTTLQAPLMSALSRVTLQDKDSSRDTRVELLARLAEYFDPADEDSLKSLGEYLRDVDPVVATAAADTVGRITGRRPTPAPTRRPIEQPSEDTLILGLTPPIGRTSLVQIWLTDGSFIQFDPLMTDAPLTVYRFRRLADAGYYNGIAFHRVEPELLIQGGSPGANSWVGAKRFLADEIGPRFSEGGAVALFTRGRHAGDAQFFITLRDAPQFDHRYTVFGRGCVPFNVLEGAIITRVVVFAPTTSHAGCQ